MPRPRSQSRRQIVEAAQVLLRRQGYQGTGLAQIIDASGAPKGSVYFLFPGGKQQIAIEAVAASATEFNEMIKTAQQSARSLPDWIHLMAEHFAASLSATGYTEGCPITTVTLDSVPGSPPLTDACRDAYDLWLSTLAGGLAAYGVPAPAAPGLARFLLISLEGALALCRAYRSTAPLLEVEEHVLALLKPYVESSSTSFGIDGHG
ncbi:TetR/AcrR family transcriptional regulator [Micromonospora sp. NPDC047548]|uniref:TetR/AcrR family transcriptional regulator n=1 Tax=Micromonospora sp. NPDC047548 TaxID=3155624 RepID=UPI0033C73B0F